jgi:ATP-binding protein involved in chromosome partitioning
MGITLEPAKPHGQSEGTHDEFRKLTREMDEKRKQEKALESVKRVIAIHSGKGGVGKTFLTVNVAYGLAQRGYDVGILDADVDCPNVPKFLGMIARLFVGKDKRFVPINHQGVKIVSMGLTRDDEAEPFLIRGPAKHRVAIDLLTGSDWGALDFLIVDLPPGTADVPLSLFEFGNVEEILYVSSPQKEAIMDTRKSIRMGKTFGVHAIGIVENMSGDVFGRDRALELAQEFGIPYLGSIPLAQEILATNERGDIAFNKVEFEPIAAPVLDAIVEVPGARN